MVSLYFPLKPVLRVTNPQMAPVGQVTQGDGQVRRGQGPPRVRGDDPGEDRRESSFDWEILGGLFLLVAATTPLQKVFDFLGG